FSMLGWILCSRFVLISKLFVTYTMSSFLLLGFAMIQFWIPPIFSLVELKPLVYNLNFPVSIFMHTILSFCALLISFFVCKNCLISFRIRLSHFFARKTSLYRHPKVSEMWIMGLIGILGMVAAKFFVATNDIE